MEKLTRVILLNIFLSFILAQGALCAVSCSEGWVAKCSKEIPIEIEEKNRDSFCADNETLYVAGPETCEDTLSEDNDCQVDWEMVCYLDVPDDIEGVEFCQVVHEASFVLAKQKCRTKCVRGEHSANFSKRSQEAAEETEGWGGGYIG